jgi:hypothetical protein
MTEHFYWIWAIFFIIPLVSIIRRYLRKRNMQNFSKSSEQYHEMQFKTNSSKIETPRRNLLEPELEHEPEPELEHEPEPELETKDKQVLGELNLGVKNFEEIQKITGLERDKLVSILKDLEKRRLIKVEEKSGLFGRKVELYLTDKGLKKYYS